MANSQTTREAAGAVVSGMLVSHADHDVWGVWLTPDETRWVLTSLHAAQRAGSRGEIQPAVLSRQVALSRGLVTLTTREVSWLVTHLGVAERQPAAPPGIREAHDQILAAFASALVVVDP